MMNRIPRHLLRLMRHPPRLLYRLGLGSLIGHLILLLTTTGRKSGLSRVTALQYEEIEGLIYVASARGTAADWYRNLVAHPQVAVQVRNRRFTGLAETTADPARIAAFLKIHLERHPRMIGRLMRAEGLPPNPTAAQLQDYAAHLALVIIHPDDERGHEPG